MKILIVLLFQLISLALTTLPPNDGQFFYVDMEQDLSTNTHTISILVGQKRNRFDIVLAAQSNYLALVSTKCPSYNCATPQKYDDATGQVITNQLVTETFNIQSGAGIHYTSLTSLVYRDEFQFQVHEFQRETSIVLDFGSIQTTSQSFAIAYDGYLGIEPAAATVGSQTYKDNFMVQLQAEKKIDLLIASIYMRADNGNSSNIKFGSWDETGVSPGSTLKMFRTPSLSQWSVMADDYSIGGAKFLTNKERNLVYSPHLPYMYIPATDWVAFADALATAYPDVKCVFAQNRCSWTVPCSQIQGSNEPLDIRIFDVARSALFQANHDDMLISGAYFGDSANTCYVPVFQNINQASNQWQLGTIYWRNYYIVLDQTTKSEGYNRMGIAPINRNDIIYKQHYKTGDTVYKPEPEKKDSSHTIPPFPNVYPSPDPPPPPPTPPKPPTPPPTPTPTPTPPQPPKNNTVNCTDPANELSPNCTMNCSLPENKLKPKCYHPPAPTPVPVPVPDNKKDNVDSTPFFQKNKILIIVLVVSLLLCCILLLIFFLRKKKRNFSNPEYAYNTYSVAHDEEDDTKTGRDSGRIN